MITYTEGGGMIPFMEMKEMITSQAGMTTITFGEMKVMTSSAEATAMTKLKGETVSIFPLLIRIKSLAAAVMTQSMAGRMTT